MGKKSIRTEEVVQVAVEKSLFGACVLTFTHTTEINGKHVDTTEVRCDKDTQNHVIRVFKEKDRETFCCEVLRLFTNGRVCWSQPVAHGVSSAELAFQLAVRKYWEARYATAALKGDWNWGSRRPVDPIW